VLEVLRQQVAGELLVLPDDEAAEQGIEMSVIHACMMQVLWHAMQVCSRRGAAQGWSQCTHLVPSSPQDTTGSVAGSDTRS